MFTEALPGTEIVCPAGAALSVWESERMNGIGGSDIAAAVGINPYESPYSLWALKTGRSDPEPDADTRRRWFWGHALEPVVRAVFAQRHPEFVVTTSPGTLARTGPGAAWQRVNVDGLVWHRHGEHAGHLAGVLECKTGTHWQIPAWMGDEVPVAYTAQGQWAMHITGAARAFMFALLDTSTDVEIPLDRDEDLITDLVELGADLWHHIVTDTTPPIDGSNATRALLAGITARNGERIDLDPEWRKHLARRQEIDDLVKDLKIERDEIGNRLRAAMGVAEFAYLDGEQVASHRQPKPRRSTDFGLLQELTTTEVYAAVVVENPQGRTLRYRDYHHTTTTTSSEGPADE